MASKFCGFVSRLTVRSIFSSCSTAGRCSSSKATSKLLNVVKSEISTKQNALENLPSFSLFNVSLDGSIATLLRSYQNEEVKVQLDVGCASEVESDEMEVESDDFEGNFEEAEMYEDDDLYEKEVAAPVFTVSVINEAGDTMQFDCSLDELSSYEENVDWSMRIDSVSVIPSSKGSAESAYYVNSSFFSEELYGGLLEFLKERGINETFPKEILAFYRVLDQHCYVNDFLGGIKHFCTSK